jgi:ATP-binding cassette, subfamily B (MDR/TAP), member 1
LPFLALIHAFSGQPIRMLTVNVASVLIGLIISFVYMWPFALVTLGILPFMSVGKALEIQSFMADEKDDTEDPKANSSSGIVVESLLNIRTIASLTIEGNRLEQFEQAMAREDPHPIRSNLVKSSTFGFSQIIQFCGFALMFWFGGKLVFTTVNEQPVDSAQKLGLMIFPLAVTVSKVGSCSTIRVCMTSRTS